MSQMPPTSKRTISRQDSLANLGELLGRKRREHQMTLSDLAQETGLAMSYLSELERGRFQDIGVEKFCRIEEALNLPAGEVLMESGHLSRPRSRRSKETNR